MPARSNDLTLLSGVEVRALEALATYRLLTVELLRAAGVGQDVKHLRASLSKLDRLGLLHRRDWDFTPGQGRNPSLHMLTPKGAKVLAELHGNGVAIKAPRAVTAAVQHVPHWLGVVRWHIALRTWAASAGVAVDWVRTEFERSEGLKRATALPGDTGPYIPDALAQVTPPDGKARLLVLEYYRAGLTHAMGQIPALGEVALAGSVETHFNSPRMARFAVVFETPALRDQALARWPNRSAETWQAFYVKAAADLTAFNDGWRSPDGSLGNLLPTQ
jgi:hypothetical protein